MSHTDGRVIAMVPILGSDIGQDRLKIHYIDAGNYRIVGKRVPCFTPEPGYKAVIHCS
jgi:hypothetical protein